MPGLELARWPDVIVSLSFQARFIVQSGTIWCNLGSSARRERPAARQLSHLTALSWHVL
jgi:hypothetical protein